MINPIQTATPLGAPNAHQQQANELRVVSDITTRNAERLEKRTVEESQAKPEQRAVEKEAAKEQQRVEEEKKKKENQSSKTPTRLEMELAERRKKVNETQNAVTKFLLFAATSSGATKAEPEASPKSESQGVDIRV